MQKNPNSKQQRGRHGEKKRDAVIGGFRNGIGTGGPSAQLHHDGSATTRALQEQRSSLLVHSSCCDPARSSRHTENPRMERTTSRCYQPLQVLSQTRRILGEESHCHWQLGIWRGHQQSNCTILSATTGMVFEISINVFCISRVRGFTKARSPTHCTFYNVKPRRRV